MTEPFWHANVLQSMEPFWLANVLKTIEPFWHANVLKTIEPFWHANVLQSIEPFWHANAVACPGGNLGGSSTPSLRGLASRNILQSCNSVKIQLDLRVSESALKDRGCVLKS